MPDLPLISRSALLLLASIVSATAAPSDRPAVPNRPPLQPTPFMALNLGSVKARGWLDGQLKLQASGLTGEAERVIPELGPESGWLGGPGEGWEKGPYYLRGLVSLAYTLDDPKLKKQAQKWIDWTLENQRENGQIGPRSSNDWWPRMVICWILRDYYEATEDPRVIPALMKYARYMHGQLPKQALQGWAKARAGDQIDTLFWLYNRTGEEFLLEVVDQLREQANQWKPFFRTLRGSEGDFRIVHGVNVSQAMKYPVVVYERTGDADDRKVFADAWKNLTTEHGLPVGMWSGTEPLSGKSTRQGIEMCSIVEQMLSSEVAIEALGDPVIGDQLERIAFNLLPGATTKDFKQFQYYTLPNSPVAARGKIDVRDDHGDDLAPSPHAGFHCCCYNLHMGWPKYVQHTWMATSDGGLAAVAYGPTEVTTVIKGTPVTITEKTDYPFSEQLRFSVKTGKPLAFPLKLRIPAWSENPKVAVNGKMLDGAKAGEFLTIDRTWKSGDTVQLALPAELQTENGFNGSASVWRGPLVFSLRIQEDAKPYEKIAGGFDQLEMTAASPWNYALDIDRDKPAARMKIQHHKMPANPWLPDTTPVTIQAPAKRLADWGIEQGKVLPEEVPVSPAASDSKLESVTLVPFGAQTLRISAFPLLRGDPVFQPGITSSHHFGSDATDAILTNPVPDSSVGEGLPRFTFWDHVGTDEWIQWNLAQATELSSLSVYWFDDRDKGEKCRVPESWKITFFDQGKWKEVASPSEYGTSKDNLNTVTFDPIKTHSLRLEIKLQDGFSGGVLQLGMQAEPASNP